MKIDKENIVSDEKLENVNGGATVESKCPYCGNKFYDGFMLALHMRDCPKKPKQA